MKVAFLIERLDPRRGGMETSSAEFLAELVLLGAAVTVVTQSAASEFSTTSVHALGVRGWGRAARYKNFVDDAQAFLKKGKWDVVHAVTPCVDCNLFQPRSGITQQALNRTVAVRKSGMMRFIRKIGGVVNSKQRLLQKLERQLLERENPPMVAALSHFMRRQLEESYALPRENIRDVFNGVTVHLPEAGERKRIRAKLRAENGLVENDLVALFAGHNFRRKGLPKILESLAKPAAEKWRLLVAGKDSPTTYQRLAKKLGVVDRVQFLGARTDVRQLYFAADVCVLPTYYDPCSRTVLESMSSGTPCITTIFDGSAECITEGENGFVLTSPEAVAELAASLGILSDRSVRARMSEKAIALRPQLSMRRHAREIFEIYQLIAAKK
ncbi:MAG: glycosyltransferase family 4 protein [Verrucomicrobiota bacterium]